MMRPREKKKRKRNAVGKQLEKGKKKKKTPSPLFVLVYRLYETTPPPLPAYHRRLAHITIIRTSPPCIMSDT